MRHIHAAIFLLAEESMMPDSEMLKVILQGGSFGLLAIFVIWVLFRGAPMLQTMLEKISTDHKATVAIITKDCSDSQREIRIWVSAELLKLNISHEKMADAINRICDHVKS